MNIARLAASLCAAFIVALGAASGAMQSLAAMQTSGGRLLFSCSAFPASTTEADLRAKFGSQNVTTGPVPDANGAEGDPTEGTILFEKDEDALLEISWKDPVGKRQPATIGRLAAHGRWQTSSGISLGTDLKTVEKLNGRPFNLAGMAFDRQGCVTSWRGGRLDAQDSGDCRVGICLRAESSVPFADRALYRQIIGDHNFSSGHPAMQALNPTVYWLVLGYGRK